MDQTQVDAVIAEIERNFVAYLHNNPENVENSANALVADLIDDAILGVIFQVDYRRKTKLDELIAGESDEQEYRIVDSPDKDIFGLIPNKKTYECICPECKRSLAASRFAPHLEKCMGMGRNSSRVASLRIANNANKDTYTAGGGTASTSSWTDDEDDVDWTATVEKRPNKKKKEPKPGLVKKLTKYPKLNKYGEGSGNGSSNGSSSGTVSLEAMSQRDRHALLSQMCGVYVDSPTKICTKSLKCSVHTEEQRRMLRDEFIHSESITLDSLQVIDVDGVEEGEVIIENFRGIAEIETPTMSSPADSASTSSSSSKSKSKSGGKSKSSSKLSTPPKGHRNSPASALPDID